MGDIVRINKLDNKHIDTIYGLFCKYQDEMIAQGAWEGHEYSSAYLEDIANATVDILSDMRKNNIKEYHDNKFDVDNILFRFTPGEFSEAISSVYGSDISSDMKSFIAESLDESFESRLEQCMDVVDEIYKDATGKFAHEVYTGISDEDFEKSKLEDKYKDSINKVEDMMKDDSDLGDELPF